MRIPTSQLVHALNKTHYALHYETRAQVSERLVTLDALLTRWMDQTQPQWRKIAKAGGDYPGNYFASKLQADTAEALR